MSRDQILDPWGTLGGEHDLSDLSSTLEVSFILDKWERGPPGAQDRHQQMRGEGICKCTKAKGDIL